MASIYQNYTWLPTQISGCQLWLDAADPATLTLSGSNVTAWNDKSGLGNNTNAVTGTPQYTSGGLYFNGSAAMFGPISNTSTVMTTFGVMSVNNSTPTDGRIVSFAIQGQADFTSGSRVIPLFRFGTSSAISSYRNPSNASAVAISYDTRLQAATVFNGTNNLFYLNGTQGGSIASSSGSFNYNRYGLGQDAGETDAQRLVGFIYEVISYNAALTTAQRQQIEGYLAWKWGLQGNLPATHPYKTFPPFMNSLTLPVSISAPIPQINNPVFLPTQVSGCQLWLDASDRSSILLSGSNVTQWNDKSSNSFNAVIFSTTAGPTLSTRNKNLILNFNASLQQCLRVPFTNIYSTSTGMSIFTIFIYANPRTYNGARIYEWRTLERFIIPQSNTNPDNIQYNRKYTDNSVSVTTGQFSMNTLYFSSYVETGDNSAFFLNGSQIGTSVRGPTLNYLPLFLGYSGNPTIGAYDFLDGQIGEVIIYNASLTTTQQQQVEGYLAWKWGLQGNLPATHPYKNSPFPGVSYAPIPVAPPQIKSASWLPTQISGCSLWLDAADSSTFSLSGSNVTQWRDKIINLTLSNVGTATSWTTNIFNRGAMLFNGGYLISQSNVFTATENVNYINHFVVMQRTQSTTYGNVAGIGFFTQNTKNSLYINANQVQIIVRRGWTTNNTRYDGPLYANTINQPYIYSALTDYQASRYQLIINGTANTATAFAGTGTTTSDSSLIYLGGSLFNEPYYGCVAEHIIYNTLLSTAQRQQVEGYLAWKWGLQANLPGDHPYKLFPPSP